VRIKPIFLIHPSNLADVLTSISCVLQVLDGVSDGVSNGVFDEGLDGRPDRDFDLLQENKNVRSS
jgi:hypothetical protein